MTVLGAKASRTRRVVLEAASAVFGRQGYRDASIAMIVEEGAFAAGTIYRYFRSQKDLFEQVVHFERDRLGQHIDASVAGATSLLDMEARSFRAFSTYVIERPQYLRIDLEAKVWAPEVYQVHLRDLALRYVELLRRYRRAGDLQGFAERDLESLAYALLSSRRYLVAHVARSPNAIAAGEQALGVYLKFVGHGLFDGRRASG